MEYVFSYEIKLNLLEDKVLVLPLQPGFLFFLNMYVTEIENVCFPCDGN